MPFVPWPKTMPSGPQLMPVGSSAGAIVTAAPPDTATLFIALSATE